MAEIMPLVVQKLFHIFDIILVHFHNFIKNSIPMDDIKTPWHKLANFNKTIPAGPIVISTIN